MKYKRLVYQVFLLTFTNSYSHQKSRSWIMAYVCEEGIPCMWRRNTLYVKKEHPVCEEGWKEKVGPGGVWKVRLCVCNLMGKLWSIFHRMSTKKICKKRVMFERVGPMGPIPDMPRPVNHCPAMSRANYLISLNQISASWWGWAVTADLSFTIITHRAAYCHLITMQCIKK